MLQFDHPEMIYLFALVPVLILLYLMMRRWKKKSLAKFGDVNMVRKLFPDVSVSRPGFKFLCILIGFVFLIVAICGPLIGSKLEEVKRKGADIIIAVDVSNSMRAEDLRPSRLERAKQSISRLIDRLDGDRIGIVVFAGDAYMQLPITTDYGAAKLFLSTIEPDIVPKQGTAIGAAIDLAATSFTDSTKKHSAIVVITDGENHEDNAVDAAKQAAEKGVKVYTIGMGSVNGAPIPVYNNGQRVGYLQDKSGNTVITKLDEAMLSDIAEAGKGRFIRATNGDDGLDLILKELNALDKKEFKSKMYTEFENQFQYFIAIALVFMIIEYLLGEKKSKWFTQLNLFGIKKKEA